MNEILKALLIPTPLLAILFAAAWLWLSVRLKEDIRRENEQKFAEHKARIDHEYNEKLATHTAKLTRENQLELTEFKHRLERTAAEQHLRFSRSFDRMADVIQNTYKMLLDLGNALTTYLENLHEQRPNPQHADALAEKWNAFSQFFAENRLFIPKRTRALISEYALTLSRFENKTRFVHNYEQRTHAREAVIRRADAEIQDLMNHLPKTLSALEDEFQELLGFPKQQHPPLAQPAAQHPPTR